MLVYKNFSNYCFISVKEKIEIIFSHSIIDIYYLVDRLLINYLRMASVTTVERLIGTNNKGKEFYEEVDEWDFCDDIWGVIQSFVPPPKKWACYEGSISFSFYENFISQHLSKKMRKQCEKIYDAGKYTDEDDEDDDEVYCDESMTFKRFTVDNPEDKGYTSSYIWFFDVELQEGYAFVDTPHINSSSFMAMNMCSIDMEEDDDYKLEYKTMEEIMDYVIDEKEKATIKKLLTLVQ